MKSIYALHLFLPTRCHSSTWEVSNAVYVVCLNMLCSVIVLYFQRAVVQQFSPSPSERPVESGTSNAISGSSYCQQNWPPLSWESRRKSQLCFELCSSAASQISKMLGFMHRDQLLLIWLRLACGGNVFAVTAFVLTARAGWDLYGRLFRTVSDSWRDPSVMST